MSDEEIARLVEQGLWPNRAAFLREAIESQLRYIHIREVLARQDMPVQDYPGSYEELLATLQKIEEEVKELRDRISLGMDTAITWLPELYALREKTFTCCRVAETLGMPVVEVIRVLQDLLEETSDGPSFRKAELALSAFQEYLRSPFADLPKSDIETWREVSRIAVWKQSAHSELTRIATTIDKVLRQLSAHPPAGEG